MGGSILQQKHGRNKPQTQHHHNNRISKKSAPPLRSCNRGMYTLNPRPTSSVYNFNIVPLLPPTPAALVPAGREVAAAFFCSAARRLTNQSPSSGKKREG